MPKRWLRIDIADIVQKHVLEVGGEPPEFFRQMVAALRPHVAMLKRVFIGMSLSGQVGIVIIVVQGWALVGQGCDTWSVRLAKW